MSEHERTSGQWGDRARWGLVVALAVAGVIVFARNVAPHAPIGSWLTWRYLRAWAWVLVFSASCVSAGHLVVRALRGARGRGPAPAPAVAAATEGATEGAAEGTPGAADEAARAPAGEVAPGAAPEVGAAQGGEVDGEGDVGQGAGETLVLSFAAGVLVFFLAMFALGLPKLYGRVTFFVVPLAMLAAGARPLVTELWPACRAAMRGPWSFGPIELAATVGGALGLLVVALPTLVPTTTSYDAQWYHMAIAEHYVAQGGVGPFVEGRLAAAVPHLASFLYAWAFLQPMTDHFDRVVLAFQLDVCMFAWALAALPVMVRRLVPSTRARGTWAGLFLFPGVFVYDAGLVGGADHVAAVWAAPIFVALLSALPALDPRACVLLAVFVAGAALTKYTAALLVVPAAVAVAGRTAWLLARPGGRSRAGLLVGPALCFAAVLALSSPHWLKNLVYHGDPLYPVLHRALKVRPWAPDADHWYAWFRASSGFSAPPTGPLQLGALLATFALVPHDWPEFHGKVPVFGALFTLLTPWLFALRGAARARWLALAAYGGVAVWSFVGTQDRYLQVLVPWMSAVAVAALVLAWQGGALVRAAVGGLVFVQIAWGATLMFVPSHTMLHAPALSAVVEFFKKSHDHPPEARLHPFAELESLGAAVPRRAKVLVHEQHLLLGLQRAAVLDMLPDSMGIDHGRTGSMLGMHAALRALGVTHLAYGSVSKARDSVAGDLIFLGYAARHGQGRQRVGGYNVVALPTEPPPASPPPLVAYLACDAGAYAPGVYEVSAMTVPHPLGGKSLTWPRPTRPWRAAAAVADAKAELADVEFLVFDPACKLADAAVREGFSMIGRRGQADLLLRDR